MRSAEDIYQQNLDAVSAALWNGDLPSMLMHIALPNYMGTKDADLVISSPDEMFIVMTEFRDQLQTLGADQYQRKCLKARFLSGRADMITGLHETRVLRRGEDVRPPYLNQVTMFRSQGRWLAFRVEAETRNSEICILSADLAEAQRRELALLDVRWTQS